MGYLKEALRYLAHIRYNFNADDLFTLKPKNWDIDMPTLYRCSVFGYDSLVLSLISCRVSQAFFIGWESLPMRGNKRI